MTTDEYFDGAHMIIKCNTQFPQIKDKEPRDSITLRKTFRIA